MQEKKEDCGRKVERRQMLKGNNPLFHQKARLSVKTQKFKTEKKQRGGSRETRGGNGK